MLRAGREPLAVAMERAGRRPRPTAPLPLPAHSAGARGSGQSEAEFQGLGPDPDDAPAPSLRHLGRPREPERPSEASLQVNRRQCCWGLGWGAPRASCGQVSSPDGDRLLRP